MRKQQEVPGHSMVLVAFSGYCKAKVRTPPAYLKASNLMWKVQAILHAWFKCAGCACTS
jgi:hypothetical protein